MDKYQVRSALNRTFPIGYNNTTGNIFIDTTGASLGNTLVYTSSGVVWQAPSGGTTTLAVGTTPITGGTVGRVLFEGAGNVLQENAILNLDTTNGLIIGGATTRATRLTVVNSANTSATKILTQRNAADSSDYTTLRGDGSIDFNNNGSTTNTYLTVGNNTYNFATTYGSLVLFNAGFGTANVWNVTGGSISTSSMYGCNNQIAVTSGTRQNNHMLGYNLVSQNSSYTSILGNFIAMNGALRSNVIGSKVSGGLLIVSTTDSTILGTCNSGNTLYYTNSLTTYFNSANASHWLHGNGNIGLFGKLYDILQDSTGTVANRLNTYMNLTATNTLTIHNGTETNGNIADAIQVYAKDITAGNSALHVWDEAGRIFYAGANVGMRSNHNLQLASNNIVYLTISTTGLLTITDASNIAVGTTTGTKIGTATTQKLSFWNATPIVQPTTAVGSATLASPGAGTNIKSDDTFDGYTLQQVVKALRNTGILA